MSRSPLALVVVFLTAAWLYAAVAGSPPPQPPLSLPPIIPLTGEKPVTAPVAPPPAKPGSAPPQPANPPAPPVAPPPVAPPPKALTVEVMVAQLRSPDAQKRLAAAEGLANSNTRDPTVIEPLAAALADADPQVRSLAAIALGHTQNKTAIAPLMTALKDEQFSVRADAVRAIQEIGGEAAMTALATALKSGDENTRVEAVHAIGRVNDPRAGAALVEALRDPQPAVVIEAAAALGEVGDLKALRPLVVTLKSADPMIRRAAARGVRWLGVAKDCEEDLAFRQKMEKRRLKGFKWEGTAFGGILQVLRDSGGMNVHVRWKPLTAAKITPTTPVTLSPALQEPDAVLTEVLLAADPKGEAAWMIYRGIVIVSTLADLEACVAARTLYGEIPCAGGPADLEVRQKLGLRLPKVECPDVPLSGFVQSLQDALKVDFKVNWQALKEFEVTGESRVTVSLLDVPAERVLRLALHDLEPTGKIGFGVKDGAVLITSSAELAPLRRQAAPFSAPPAPGVSAPPP